MRTAESRNIESRWSILCALLLACASSLAVGQTVKIGHLGIVADGPFYIAIEKGYFKEQGLDVSLERFNSAAQATGPLSTNEVQVVGGGLSAALFNAFSRGWPVRIALSRTRDMPGFSSDTLIVRNDLKDSVKQPRDLRGKTIAVNAPSAALHYMVARMLEADGLKISDVKIVYMPWPNMGPAFETKAIDAGAVVEPFVELYNGRGLAFPFKRAADVMKDPPFEVSVILYNTDWESQHADQARAFTVAYLKGARDYYDAMRGGSHRAEVVDILTKYTSLKDRALYDRIQWEYVDPNGQLDSRSLRDQQDWYKAQGTVTSVIDVDKMMDRRFLDFALDKLGRVEVK